MGMAAQEAFGVPAMGQPLKGFQQAGIERFAGGGIIGMYIEGDKVRFEANPDAAQRAGIKLSSQILKLARIVKDARSGR